MSTLSPIDPAITYFDMEPLVCDAQSIVDCLFAAVDGHFAVKPDEHGRYILSSEEGSRLFFLAGLASSMAEKARRAYYVAHENEAKAKEARS